MRRATWARAVTALLATSLLATGWGGHVLRPDNHTRIGWPGLKTDPEFAAARRLRDLLGPETVMLGPNNVTAWGVTLRRHPIPLLARPYHGRLHGDEGARPGPGQRPRTPPGGGGGAAGLRPAGGGQTGGALVVITGGPGPRGGVAFFGRFFILTSGLAEARAPGGRHESPPQHAAKHGREH